MPGNFTVQFLDLMVYVMPGTIVLLGLLGRHGAAALTRVDSSKHIAHYLFLGFLGAFTIGFIIHISFAVALGSLDRVVGSRRLERLLDEIPELRLAEVKAKSAFEIQLPDRMAFFRFAEGVVEEELPIRNATASRLEALALFSRNAIPAIIVFALVALRPAAMRRSNGARLAGSVALVVTVGLLWHGYLVFSRNGAQATIRSFIYWCEVNERVQP